MEIVGIVGDAALRCVKCARNVYGDFAIDAALSGVWGGLPIDVYRGLGPTDGEGNVLGVVFSVETTGDDYCNDCLEKL